VRGLVIVAAVVLGVGLRVWRRRRRKAAAAKPSSYLDAFSGGVGLVAAREIRERLRTRLFKVGTLIILLVVAAAIVIPTVRHSTAVPQRVGVVGALSPAERASTLASASAVATTVRFVAEPSLVAARTALRDKRIDVAIVDGTRLLILQPLAGTDNSTHAQFVAATARSLGIDAAFAAAHLSAQQATILRAASSIPVLSVEAGSSKAKPTVSTTSVIGVILIFVMLQQYNTWILIGVMEEKSSRVIEVLLAALRPMQLLAGKVLGIGLVAFLQAALIVGFALGLAKAVGSTLVSGSEPLVLLATLVWLVVGYAFYCWVYAAAGSMAERQDQVQSLAFPLTLPMIFGYIVSLTAASTGPSTLLRVIAYLPPTAPFAMPVLVGLHAASWWQFALSVAIAVASTVAMARLATMIYRRAILRTGRRVRWREVFSRATS
jgi:ABC-2 type transport system permease protein